MSKRPTDHLEPSAKKRGNSRQLTKDDASNEDEEAEAQGEFRQATAEVMKNRRVVRPKRGGGNLAASTTSAAPSNPFSGVSLTGGATNPFAGVNLLAQGAGSNPFAQLQPAPMAPPVSTSGVASNGTDQPQQASAQAPAPGAEVPAASSIVTSAKGKTAETGSDAAKAPSTSKLTQPDPQPSSTGERSDQAAAAPSTASADFSSFVSSNKQDSPFAVKASGESSAFGNGTATFSTAGTGFGSTAAGFGSTAGGFGAVGTGLGTTTGGFGALGKDSSTFGKSSSTKEETKADGTGFSIRPASSTAAASTTSEASPATSPSTSPVQQSLPADQAATTGEEGETVLYEAEGTLFQFDDQDTKTWRERGRGELRVNKAPSGQARLVMRQRGNLRLLLNANLWPKMPVSMMDGGKGVTFPCINHAQMEESEDGAKDTPEESKHVPKLASFAFRKKIVSKLEELVRVIEQETSPSAAV